jgi:S-disulfanyl-L-cysteine oxidoreductase SoxD
VTTTALKAMAIAVVGIVLIVLAYGLGLWWGHVHMARQPAVGPQQALVQLPADSVPRDRAEPFRRPYALDELVIARVDAGRMPNPIDADARSLERGAFVYEIHCQVCHGADGRGDGPVGTLFVPPPMDLTLPYVQNLPEGQVFYTVSYGSLVMPQFHHAITIEDRWHVVNYVRNMGTQ